VLAGAGFAGAGLAGGFAWEARSGTAINRLAKTSNEARLNIGVRLFLRLWNRTLVLFITSPVHHQSCSSPVPLIIAAGWCIDADAHV
jgi:hypothetical protein